MGADKLRYRSQSKWVKYKILKGLKELAPFLPETQRLTRRSLGHYIEKFETVMLKPSIGNSGYGIIQVSLLEEQRYAIQTEKRKIILDGKQALYDQIDKMTSNRSYIVQQRIALAHIENNPFDIRVVVRRKHRHAPFQTTGMFAKAAEEGYVVTNVSSQVIAVKRAIEYSNMKPASTQKVIKRIKNVSVLAAEYLHLFYPFQKIIGFDIGLDRDARVWIIEANFKPSMKPFLLLKKRK